MMNYSAAVILEGDNPLEYAELEVFVAPAPDVDETLFMRRQRDLAAAQRATVDAWERMPSQPDSLATWMEEVVGVPVGDLLRKKPMLGEDVRTKMLAGIAAARNAPPAKPIEYWAVSKRLRGIERAGLVVVNVRDPHGRAAAEQLVAAMGPLGFLDRRRSPVVRDSKRISRIYPDSERERLRPRLVPGERTPLFGIAEPGARIRLL